tara:strand:- start:2981 stop:3187 length:207 start_codon:yes stop_codon:yes gene_type:complete
MNHLSIPSGLHLSNRDIQTPQSTQFTVHDTIYSEKLFNNLLNKQASSVKGRCTRKKKANTRNSTKKAK